MRILNYNTMLLPSAGYDNAQRASLIARADFMAGHDVVVLEELFDNSASDALLKGLHDRGYVYQTPVIGRNSPDWDEPHHSESLEDGGVAIVSRHRITYKAEAEFPEGCGWDHESAKGFAYARIVVGGANVHVFGTHPQADTAQGEGLYPCGGSAVGYKTARQIRLGQLRQMNAYIAAKERSGMVPGGDMVVVAGDINVDRHGDEYRDMLGALSLTAPDASLGWPYSYDTHNNTIGRIRDGDKVGQTPIPSRPQDLDHVLPREGHARPARWNSRVLTGTYPWQTTYWTTWWAYTDYSDHYPIVAGPGVGESAGTYSLTVDRVELTEVGEDACGGRKIDAFGRMTVQGADGSPRVLWSRTEDESTVKHKGDTFPLTSVVTKSAHGFAINVDVMDDDWVFCGGGNDNAPYGTVWWNNEDGVGQHSKTLVGPETESELRVTYTVNAG
ncbi:sphingomyelin phosphodiesterase [Streptomyces sp. NPDC088341]|uniref:sphingomyelin phosphodiesterase n=1 Tax=Streptomyces sp. NPDC088341 TaxID=3154870 RepID=UPI0034193462